jgi:hypothetical protein
VPASPKKATTRTASGTHHGGRLFKTIFILVTNAVIAWNTVHMAAVLEQFRAQGHAFADADVSGAATLPPEKKLEEARRLVQLELAALEAATLLGKARARSPKSPVLRVRAESSR